MSMELLRTIITSFGYIGGVAIGGFTIFKLYREYNDTNEKKLQMRYDTDIKIAKEQSTGDALLHELLDNQKKINEDIERMEEIIREIREDRLEEKEKLQKQLDELKRHLYEMNLDFRRALFNNKD